MSGKRGWREGSEMKDAIPTQDEIKALPGNSNGMCKSDLRRRKNIISAVSALTARN